MKLRSEIEENFKWDIGLFKTNKEVEKAFEIIKNLTEIMPKYYGKLSNKDIFYECFVSHNKEYAEIGKLNHYIGNSLNVDSSNTEMLKLSERFEFAISKLNKASSFIDPQMQDLPEDYLKSLLLDDRFKDLKNMIEFAIANKPHKLDEKTSQVISALSNSFNNSSSVFDVFTDSEMPFEDAVDSEGNKHSVTNATYGELISSTDPKLRETAFNSMMNGYGKFNKTFASLFISNLKTDNEFKDLHNWKTLLSEVLNDEKIPEKVFEKNITNVCNNLNVLQDYIKTYKEKCDNKNFAYYDLFTDNKITGTITIEQAQQIILKALEPLGEEYLNLVKHKFCDKSIDYMPNQNKNSGAYCSNCYDAKTLILMNWTNDYNSVSTLIHEMGHCINAEYFNKTQPFENANITIFAAEIASTVNEILLNQYMLQNCKKNEKEYYLKHFFNDVRSTIYRQTLFSEFELFAHTAIENEQPLTYEELNQKYYELNQKYYGDSCILPENLKYEWSRIPHFYNPYYVYSYSTGMLTAISIASKLINDKTFAEKYIYFLKNGTNKPAIEVLKEIGIDLTTDEPFNVAFNFIKQQLDIYKQYDYLKSI